jgi:hypothetical protein
MSDRGHSETVSEPVSEKAQRYEELAKIYFRQANESSGLRRAERLAIAAGWQGMAKGLERALSRLTCS